jgi:glutaminase
MSGASESTGQARLSRVDVAPAGVDVAPAGVDVAPAGVIVGSDRYEDHRDIFDSFTRNSDGTISRVEVLNRLYYAGIAADDIRVRQALAADDGGRASYGITFEAFARACHSHGGFIARALRGGLVIPDFAGFSIELTEMYESILRDDRGWVAHYIPHLRDIEPDQLAIAVCTVDGQRLALGASQARFSLQAVCKPINYCLVLDEHGPDVVHRHVGQEPTGPVHNGLSLNDTVLPHNPMINSGALMCCSLIRPELAVGDRFDHVASAWRRLSGGGRVELDEAAYLSDRETSDHTSALGHALLANGAFPAGTDIEETLDFYRRCRSIRTDAESLSAVAAALANGGVAPITNDRVLSASTVQRCVSLMVSCGTYDYSGEFAFDVGVPAKSGVSGALMIVIPHVMGICVWSPRLDSQGNPVRGLEFSRQLVSRYNFQVYDGLVEAQRSRKRDPRLSDPAVFTDVVRLCWAAAAGDLDEVRSLTASGVNADIADYDGRTALHVAACEGNAEIVAHLLEQSVNPAPVDRWGRTPLAEAEWAGHADVVDLLERRVVRRFDTTARTAFASRYANVLTQAWASEEFAHRLESRPQAVLAAHGLPTVAGAHVTIVRTLDADPSLETQIALWERGQATGEYVLYVPYTPPMRTTPALSARQRSYYNPCSCADG